ncbi:MerR family transcriptional regulator [Undibacterium sp. RTI2.2]|uniref:MerR family transcriptional regulator n=2 Tax=unclassified Undibacterium TaxID=2630295 RepID=UPI002AB452B7|nr:MULTISPECIES: MerR family transcriptional regulator [unclassified Undibacterium]MDY7539541.1 MerR family transcriptional regulator [Undibacterium sp. 5I1]MEB0116683.1 MerR family transcriptional regulator [Undibacterium sp. RTI2.2]MEB0232875.1 MerR family transcriptional regulator [Undibacterium sp. 10I3]MEB0258590.1 MerR family transcriptional regulator [Undibacterium sp. 5I1]
MASENNMNDPHAATYRSGIAARLAGVPVETLRVWERRYSVVGPRLSERGQRLYSSTEIKRLTLIKQLVDMGHSIGSIAALPTDALIAMRSAARTLEAPPRLAGELARELRVGLIGPLVSSRRFEETLSDNALRVVGRAVNVVDATTNLQNVRADVIVIELPLLNEATFDTVAGIKKMFGASQAIVLYRFAPSAVIRRLRSVGHEVARAPSDAIEIESLCRALLKLPQTEEKIVAPANELGDPPPPRFDEHALSELANATNLVYCECPRHLVELVTSLGSFERYSAECANRNADDAALHRDLQQTAGHARAILENALVRVAIAEGLELPPSMKRVTEETVS